MEATQPKNITNDMTEGAPLKLIVRFFVPIVFGVLFQQAYSVIDTMIVSKFLGAKALAAVGSTGPLNFMVVGFCIGMCNGFIIPVAKAFGAKDENLVREYIANGAWMGAGLALVMALSVGIFCKSLLIIMATPSDILEDAYNYIFVIFLGIPVVCLYNFLAGIFRALGDSKTPLYCLIVSSISNIILDLLFITGFKTGVGGAALATIISQAIAGVLCLLYIKKGHPILKISKEQWRPNIFHMKKLCVVGLTMGFQYCVTSLGSVIVQVAVNSLGSLVLAAITAAGKICSIFTCIFDALGTTMTTYAGQNMGARKIDRITEGIKVGLGLGTLYTIFVCIICFSVGETLALLFVDKSDTVVIQNTATWLKITTIFYFPLLIIYIVRFTLQGMGYTPVAVVAGAAETIARGLIGFIFVPWFGFKAAALASPLAWIFADLIIIPAYIYILKRLREENNTSVTKKAASDLKTEDSYSGISY
jgi:putative MATE family efflux protein